MAQSKLIAGRSKKSTVLVSVRGLEEAVNKATMLIESMNPNDPNMGRIEAAVKHMSLILSANPQQMKQDGVANVADYMDDAKMPAEAAQLKNEVDMIEKLQSQQRGQTSPATTGGVFASQKKANGGAAFSTDRDEKGEAKAPEKLEVPRIAKKKKEAVPEPVAAAPIPPPAPASSGTVNPIEYIPTETLIKVIEDLPKEEDFAQNKGKQDALIELTNILKARPVMPPEQSEAAAPAPPQSTAPAMAEVPAAPAPVSASSKKRADLGDHAMGNGGTIGGGSSSGSNGRSNTAPQQVSTNPSPDKAKIDLGGLNVASALEEEKTAEDYRVQDFKVTEEGIRPDHGMPTMDEQEAGGHHSVEFPENKFEMQSAAFKAAAQRFVDEVGKIASGVAGGWSTSYKPMEVDEDGGRTPEIAEAHAGLEDNTGISKPETTMPIKLNDQRSLKTSSKKAGLAASNKTGAKKTADANDLEIMEHVAEILQAKGIDAYVEYPGWISVGELAFGTANETWGYNDETGDIAGELGIPRESNDVEAIAEAIAQAAANPQRSDSDDQGPSWSRSPQAGAKKAAEMTTSKAVKESEQIGNSLKKMYLDAKSLTQVNDTRPVREAVEGIFRAADMFDEATKTLNKQNQQEISEAEAAKIKSENKKKSSFGGLAVAEGE